MKLYKDTTGKVFGFDSWQKVPADLIELTAAEVEAHINPEPSAEQVLEDTLLALKATRDSSLLAITHALADGAVVQVRPKDLNTLTLAISEGTAEDWVLADDTVRELTVAEMQEALLSGIEQGKVIWRVYTKELKQL